MANVLINKQNFITEDSEVFRSTNIIYLLDCFLIEEATVVTILVPSAFHSEMIKRHIDTLIGYFKKPVNIIVDQSISKPTTDTTVSVKQAPLYGFIAQEFIETPFFIGESNKEAYYKTMNLIQNHGIVFIYGPVGTGKTHLLHLLAYKAHNSGMSVYINTSNGFLEEIKNHMENKNVHNFINFLSSMDVLILDDIQKLNNKGLQFTHDILFEITNNFILRRKRIAFTSDIPPTDFAYMREAITSRLLTGAVKIETMDNNVKSQYIDHFCKENSISLSEDIKNFLVKTAQNGRELKFLLNVCYFLHNEKQLTLNSLIARIPQNMNQLNMSFNKTVFSDIYRLLNDYYGISFSVKEGSKKRSRLETNRDSIVYFLLSDKMNPHELRKRLLISSNNHLYYHKKGQELFSQLPQDIQNRLRKIIEDSLS